MLGKWHEVLTPYGGVISYIPGFSSFFSTLCPILMMMRFLHIILFTTSVPYGVNSKCSTCCLYSRPDWYDMRPNRNAKVYVQHAATTAHFILHSLIGPTTKSVSCCCCSAVLLLAVVMLYCSRIPNTIKIVRTLHDHDDVVGTV